MKPSSCLFLNVLLAVFFLSSTFPLSAQDDSVITISGIVKDQKSKKKLEYVNISVQGTNIGTVSNSDGEFTLKIPVRYKSDNLLFTHLGYNNHLHPIGGKNIENETFMLTSDSQVLDEVVIRSGDPLAIVREAVKKIDLNYTNSPTILSGFYRETIQKGKRYIDISEAVMNIYKTSYNQNTDNDDIQRTEAFKPKTK